MNSYQQIANAINTLSTMEQSKLLDYLHHLVQSNMADEISNMADNDCDAPEVEVVEEEEEDYFLLHHADADCSHYEGLGEKIKWNADNIVAPMIDLSAGRRNKVVEELAVHFGMDGVEIFKWWVKKIEEEVSLVIERLPHLRGIDTIDYTKKLNDTYKVVFQDFTHHSDLTIEIVQRRSDFNNFVLVLIDNLSDITSIITGWSSEDYTDEEINGLVEEVRALDFSKWELLGDTPAFIDRLVGLSMSKYEQRPCDECCVCYDNTRCRTYCGHSVCSECYWGMERVEGRISRAVKCPMCRTQISGRIDGKSGTRNFEW
jgi:hypothetical protein